MTRINTGTGTTATVDYDSDVDQDAINDAFDNLGSDDTDDAGTSSPEPENDNGGVDRTAITNAVAAQTGEGEVSDTEDTQKSELTVFTSGFLTEDTSSTGITVRAETATGEVVRRLDADEVGRSGQVVELPLSETQTVTAETATGEVKRSVELSPGEVEQLDLDHSVPDYAVARGDAPPGYQGDDGSDGDSGNQSGTNGHSEPSPSGADVSLGGMGGGNGNTGSAGPQFVTASGSNNGGALALLAAAAAAIWVILNGS